METPAETEVSTPRSVLMDDGLWGDCVEAASDRQKRLRQRTTASDIIRDGARLLALEEMGVSASASHLIADAIREVLIDYDERAMMPTLAELRAIVRGILLGEERAE